jgi:GT2 family glycosyltransferase
MMDDDAEPFEDALEHLLRVAVDPANVYGSLAVRGEDTSWTTTLVTPTGGHSTDIAEEIPAIAQVQSLPFLGFLIHRNLVERIGLPDAGYFIAADDVEYCLRAERAGALIMVAGRSRIDHPRADSHQARILGRNFIFLRIPPWKRYYDTRNRLLIARKYYGYRFYTRTIPGSFLRLGASLAGEKQRAMQIWAFVAGMIDGLLGLKGRRHNRWRISQ